MTDVLVVFGTRPEAIKMAPLAHKFRDQSDVDLKVCVTGQHREMLHQVLDIFDVQVDYDLDVMKSGQDLAGITSRIVDKMNQVLKELCPKIVLVHGDTTTTFATSLACFYNSISVGHVEAGLRTHDLRAPFPEEFNRRVAGLVSEVHFCPTISCKNNLLAEGVPEQTIHVTGNTVVDALQWAIQKIETDPKTQEKIDNFLEKKLQFDWLHEEFILITGHRRENFGSGFLEICKAIRDLSIEFPNLKFVYPVHLNPNVQEPVNKILSSRDNVYLIEPLEYLYFIRLLSTCLIVLTDSGGIQEEAPGLGKPVLVMRDVTERPEALEAGAVKLVGASRENITKGIRELLNTPTAFEKMISSSNPYGDGKASDRIVKIVKERLSAEY